MDIDCLISSLDFILWFQIFCFLFVCLLQLCFLFYNFLHILGLHLYEFCFTLTLLFFAFISFTYIVNPLVFFVLSCYTWLNKSVFTQQQSESAFYHLSCHSGQVSSHSLTDDHTTIKVMPFFLYLHDKQHYITYISFTWNSGLVQISRETPGMWVYGFSFVW